jgi:hypothetical protein
VCEGEGIVRIPGYSINPFTGIRVIDPQCETDARCGACRGTGVVDGRDVGHDDRDHYDRGRDT